MNSIAEVTTGTSVLIYKFDSESEEEVAEVNRVLGELADQGMIFEVEFYSAH